MMRPKKGTLYLLVTADKYELPVAVFDYPAQAAEWIGCDRRVALTMLTRGQVRKKGVPFPCRIIRVIV